MTCHHLVLQALPEMAKTILRNWTVKAIKVLNDYILIWCPLKLKPRHLIQIDPLLLKLPLVSICVEKIIDLFIVQLNV